MYADATNCILPDMCIEISIPSNDGHEWERKMDRSSTCFDETDKFKYTVSSLIIHYKGRT